MASAGPPKVSLVVPPPPRDEALRMLSAWTWLLPPRLAAVSVNRFGDWYISTPDGAIHLLSIWDGTFEQVAPSYDAWRAWLATDDGMEANWVDMVLLLYDRGQRLADGDCFAPYPPPIGSVGLDVNRIMVSNHGAMTIMMGQMFEQLARRPG